MLGFKVRDERIKGEVLSLRDVESLGPSDQSLQARPAGHWWLHELALVYPWRR